MGHPGRLRTSTKHARRVDIFECANPPNSGKRNAKRFDEIIEIDLFFSEEYIFLETVGAYTYWTRAVLAPSQQSDIVFEILLAAWIHPFGTPREVTMDAGGRSGLGILDVALGESRNRSGFPPQEIPRFFSEGTQSCSKGTILRKKDSRREWGAVSFRRMSLRKWITL